MVVKKNDVTKTTEVVTGQLQNKGVVAQLKGVIDRNGAEALIGWDIFIDYAKLPPAKHGESQYSHQTAQLTTPKAVY